MQDLGLNQLPRSKGAGYVKKNMMIIFAKVVTPEFFYRGSSPSFAWIPAKSMRE